MAASEVSICNLALQKLGAGRITALTENSNNARQVNACYEALRDKELRVHPWNFAVTPATLTPSATAPADPNYGYAFPLPADCLRLLLPNRSQLDWNIVRHQNARAILTNDGDSISIRYIARVTDPNEFDPAFVDMLACKIAENCCEQITQSNDKKADVQQQYKLAKADARMLDAFEDEPLDAPESGWETARLGGQ